MTDKMVRKWSKVQDERGGKGVRKSLTRTQTHPRPKTSVFLRRSPTSSFARPSNITGPAVAVVFFGAQDVGEGGESTVRALCGDDRVVLRFCLVPVWWGTIYGWRGKKKRKKKR